MKLKKITLQNIRSYEKESIEFPSGSTLLSGDIGSGKTSVLLGIEFALFGLQPGQKGSSLLRNGHDTGGVVMEFAVDDSEIILERFLKRGKGITQDYCSITIDGEKREIAVTELKDKVLELLNYPKEFAKRQNLLYKFTVYTPQEEMKQIIIQDAETRVNTLRHVFGIDKYKRVLENLAILTSKLREEKRVKQALTSNVEQDKLEILEKENELESKHYNLTSVEREFFLKAEARKRIQEERDSLQKKVEEKKLFEKEIEKSRLMTINKKDLISGNLREIQKIKTQISELDHLKFEETKIKRLENDISILKTEKKSLEEKNMELTSKISSLNLKNKDFETLKVKLQHLEICPTCLQDVEPSYKANVFNKLNSDIVQNKDEMEKLTGEKLPLIEQINKAEQDISAKEREVQELRILKVKVENLNERRVRLKDLENLNLMSEKDILLLESQTERLKSSVFELNRFENLEDEKRKELEIALREERIAEIKVAELRKEIEVFSHQISELRSKIEKTEKIRKELDYITDVENWLSKNFASLISFVEKNVMAKLKAEFSKFFSQWFAMLVAETFNTRINDDFTPIIEQQDYEIDYAYLSGGERTAVALAYRLALNQVLNSFLSNIKTRDFVILDEPTDGFSDQQLDKMRSVLEQLNVAQLIIVSHEQKIEGFVENVIRFKKENGISKIV
ncbi:MAG: AAA family ATPase [Nanoarchaeota archaeon]